MSDRVYGASHSLACDWPGCGNVLDDWDGCDWWESYGRAVEEACQYDHWAQCDGRDYCPGHWHLDADEERRPGPPVCAYPGCGKAKAADAGGWMHEADGTDWCPKHWRFDEDGWMRPQTWFEGATGDPKEREEAV